MAIDFSDLGGQAIQPSGSIDFSDLGGQRVTPSYSTLDKAKLVGKMMGAASELTPTSQIKEKVLDPAGEAIAEAGGRTGHPAIAYPAAAVGTMVSEAPAFLGSAVGLDELYSPDPLAKAIRNTPKMLGKQYKFQNEAAGVTGKMPEFSGRIPGYESASADTGDIGTVAGMTPEAPISYPKDPGGFFNMAKNRIETLREKISPDEVMTYKQKLGKILDLGESRVNKLFGREGAYGQVAALKGQATDLENSVFNTALKGKTIPAGYELTRTDLNNINALSNKLRIGPDLARKIWSYLGPKFRWGDILVQ